MSNIKNRLIKLEETQAAQTKQVSYVSSEETRQWLNDLIQSINDGTHISKPWVIRPAPSNAGPATTFTYNLLNRITEQQE
jgi:hypothetical protein